MSCKLKNNFAKRHVFKFYLFDVFHLIRLSRTIAPVSLNLSVCPFVYVSMVIATLMLKERQVSCDFSMFVVCPFNSLPTNKEFGEPEREGICKYETALSWTMLTIRCLQRTVT